MSTLLATIPVGQMKTRWEEPFTSESLNVSMASRARGVVYGFDLQPAGGLTVELQVNADRGGSLLVHFDSTNQYSLSYFTTSNVSFDLTAGAGTTVYIGVNIVYLTGVATVGEFRIFSQAEYDGGLGDVVLVGRVDIPGAGAITAAECNRAYVDYVWKDYTRDGAQVVRLVQDPKFRGESLRDLTAEGNIASPAAAEVAVDPNGLNAVRFYLDAAGTASGSLYFGMLPVQENGLLLVEFDMRAAAVTAGFAGAAVLFYDQSFAFVSVETLGESSLAAVTVAYQTYASSIPVPATAAFAVVTIGIDAMTAGSILFQNLQAYSSGNFDEQTLSDAVRYVKTHGLRVHSASGSVANGLSLYADSSRTIAEWVGAPGTFELRNFSTLEIAGAMQADEYTTSVDTDFYSFLWAGEVTRHDAVPAGPDSIIANTGSGEDWAAFTIVSGGGLFEIPLAREKLIGQEGAIVEVLLGVDKTVDAGFSFEVSIQSADVTTGTEGASTLLAAALTTRVAGTDFATLSSGAIAVGMTAMTPDRALVLRIVNNGTTSHKVIFVRFRCRIAASASLLPALRTA